MKRHPLGLAAALILAGCCTTCPTGKLVDLLQQNPKPKAELQALAREAEASAAKQSDAQNKVSCYRVASVAAWQSEDDSLVLPISTAGMAACDALPNRDAGAPADCTLIRASAPMATQDKIAQQLAGFQAKKQASPAQTLPAADLGPLQQDFDDLERQFQKLSTIRTGVNSLSAPPAVAARVERYRLIVLCNAITAMTLYGAADGASVDTFKEMGQRKKQMTQDLGMVDAQVTTQCRIAPPVADPGP